MLSTRSATSRARRRLLPIALAAAVALATATAVEAQAHPGGTSRPSAAFAPPDVLPSVGQGTHFLDDDAILAGANLNDPSWYIGDADWYKANIPFVDLPDKQMQDAYYYRWSVTRRNLRYTTPGSGYITTEFIPQVGWADGYNSLNDATGHHIYDGRWLRDQSYMNDYIQWWLTGPGVSGAHHFSADWLDDAIVQRAAVSGDYQFALNLLPQMIAQYNGWSNQYDSTVGLYWSIPSYDAMENEPAGFESTDPFGGVPTYRPTLNSYQYGNAMAIAALEARNGDTAAAAQWTSKAQSLRTAMNKILWDRKAKFYYDVIKPDNPTLKHITAREAVGFIPWYFGIPDSTKAPALGQLFDHQGFAAKYGPTTTERRSKWFMYQAEDPRGWDGGCCHWDGPEWPFATSQDLTGLATVLDTQHQSTVTTAQFDALLHTYANDQYKDGHPWVAEAADPDTGRWIYDAPNHSEHYDHSSYVDLVLSDLLGLRASDSSTLTVQPQVPTSWTHFAVENAPYHGHNVTVIYDRDGTVYHQGKGMFVYVDGTLVTSSPTVAELHVPIGASVKSATDIPAGTGWRNDAVNVLQQGYPKISASYTNSQSNPAQANDGQILYDQYTPTSRWTNQWSPNAQDWLSVDFGHDEPVQDIRVYLSSAGGNYAVPKSMVVQYWTGSTWVDAPDQVHTPSTTVPDGLNRITFPTVYTDQVRVLFTNAGGSYGYVGVTELESWAPAPATPARQRRAVQPTQLLPGPATNRRR